MKLFSSTQDEGKEENLSQERLGLDYREEGLLFLCSQHSLKDFLFFLSHVAVLGNDRRMEFVRGMFEFNFRW